MYWFQFLSCTVPTNAPEVSLDTFLLDYKNNSEFEGLRRLTEGMHIEPPVREPLQVGKRKKPDEELTVEQVKKRLRFDAISIGKRLLEELENEPALAENQTEASHKKVKNPQKPEIEKGTGNQSPYYPHPLLGKEFDLYGKDIVSDFNVVEPADEIEGRLYIPHKLYKKRGRRYVDLDVPKENYSFPVDADGNLLVPDITFGSVTRNY